MIFFGTNVLHCYQMSSVLLYCYIPFKPCHEKACLEWFLSEVALSSLISTFVVNAEIVYFYLPNAKFQGLKPMSVAEQAVLSVTG